MTRHLIHFGLILCAALPATATEQRQLSAHAHGTGAFNMAVAGEAMALELTAPGADIVGFEYLATSAEDKALVVAAMATLQDPLALFITPPAAECTLTSAALDLEFDADTPNADVHWGRASHGHDHDHSTHADGTEGNDKHAASHSEFHAVYEMSCAEPDALTHVTFDYFEVFPNARELEVQVVTEAGATALSVTRDAPELHLKDLF
ncbi:MAG: DUF2796 domain-containing protein [Marinovum sp.]|nr:DUF2796 domain-containing protein [Marinovum sp.]